jgi:PAS domain S-box-containing protein
LRKEKEYLTPGLPPARREARGQRLCPDCRLIHRIFNLEKENETMTKKNLQREEADKKLRRRAEELLSNDLAGQPESSAVDTQKLIHELRVHQVELEMQNEELRQAQAELAQSRDRYLELYDFAPIGYFTLDKKGLIKEVNLAGAELLGLERARLIRQRFSRFIAPGSQDTFYFHRKRVLESEDRQVCELVLVNKDGAQFHAQLQTVSVGAGKQSSSQLHIAAIDITARIRFEENLKTSHEELERQVEARTSELIEANLELQEEIVQRRQIELKLQDSEEKYRIVVENANEGIVVTQDGKIEFLNVKFEDISGYTKKELAGLPMVELVHPDDAAMVREYQTQEMQDRVQPQPYNLRVVDKAGQTRWLRNKRVLIEWNRRPAMLSFLEDITAQMHSEQALKEIDEQLKNIFLESPIGIAVYDAQGLLYAVNKSYMNIYGISDVTRIMGKSLFDDPLLNGKTKKSLMEGNSIREEMALDYAKTADPDMLDPSRTGTLYLDMLITPLGKSMGDSVVGYMAQVQDITEGKNAERSIHDLSQQLIRAHESERQMIARELHDRVGQDLSSLKMDFDSLSNEYPDHLPKTRKKITALSALMQKTISDIRNLAYELRPPGLDHFGFMQTVIQFGKDFKEKTGLDVDMSFTGIQDLLLDFDEEINLYRVIQEGLNNINKHARAKRVVVKMVASHPSIIIRIEDDGIGFDPEKRIASSIREKRMGLRSMQERANLLGGKMSILSQPGRGTEILIEVPCLGRRNG